MSNTLDKFKDALARQFTSAPRAGVEIYASHKGVETGSRIMQDQVRSLSAKPGMMETAVFWKDRLTLIAKTTLKDTLMGAAVVAGVIALPAVESKIAQQAFNSELAIAAERGVASADLDKITSAVFDAQWANEHRMSDYPQGSPAQLLGEALRHKVHLFSIAAEGLDSAPLHDQALISHPDSPDAGARPACVILMAGHMVPASAMAPDAALSGSSIFLTQIARIADQAAHCVEDARPDNIQTLDVTVMASLRPDLTQALVDHHYGRNLEESRSGSFGVAFARYWSETLSISHSDSAVQDMRSHLEGETRVLSLDSLSHQGGIPDVDIGDLVDARLKLLAGGATPSVLHAFDVKATQTILERTSPEQLLAEGRVISKDVWVSDARAAQSPSGLSTILEAAAPLYSALGVEVDFDRLGRKQEMVESANVATRTAQTRGLSMMMDHLEMATPR